MTIISLWMPIVVSAVFVWIMSALVWMLLPWHKSDWIRPGDEEALRAALKGATPGNYMLPYCIDPNDLKDEAVRQKFIDGPLAYITVIPNGLPKMGPKLMMTFAYYLVVGIIAAYFVSRTVGAGNYLEVFRVAGTTAFVAYGIAYIQDSIWFGRPWSLTAKTLLDALIYALLTGGVFGWLV